ncbi:MAG: radical SAM protein [Elusimicrobiota bacterium]
MNNNPKVLLVYPGSKLRGFAFPIGLLYVAQALLKKNIDVSFIHLGIDSPNKIKPENYLFVGISMLTGRMILDGLQAAKLIKNYNKKIPIVLGGVHPSLLPKECLQNELVDIVVIGEGDETVQELALSLLNKQDLSKVKGIAYKDTEKNIIVNPPRDFIDMNKLDFDLPYHLLGKNILQSYELPIHTSRGCPYRCSFCYSTAFHKRKYRAKSAEKVVDEIEYLYKKYNITSFDIGYEDEFFTNPDRNYEILKTILKKGLKIRWSSFCRFNTFDNAITKLGTDFVDVIKKSGCDYLAFGAESGSQRLLDEIIKKDITVEQIIRTVNYLKNYKIPHRINFMCCFPTETQNDLNATFDIINKISYNNSSVLFGIHILVPFPGTPIFNLLKKDYAYKTPSTLEKWGEYNAPFTSYKKVTWLPNKYAKMCFNLNLLFGHIFFKDFKSYKMYKEFIRNSNSSTVYPTGYIGYLIAKIQRWRYKNRVFDNVVETILFSKFIKIQFGTKRFIVNCILRKYLSPKIYQILRNWFRNKELVYEQ